MVPVAADPTRIYETSADVFTPLGAMTFYKLWKLNRHANPAPPLNDYRLVEGRRIGIDMFWRRGAGVGGCQYQSTEKIVSAVVEMELKNQNQPVVGMAVCTRRFTARHPLLTSECSLASPRPCRLPAAPSWYSLLQIGKNFSSMPCGLSCSSSSTVVAVRSASKSREIPPKNDPGLIGFYYHARRSRAAPAPAIPKSFTPGRRAARAVPTGGDPVRTTNWASGTSLRHQKTGECENRMIRTTLLVNHAGLPSPAQQIGKASVDFDVLVWLNSPPSLSTHSPNGDSGRRRRRRRLLLVLRSPPGALDRPDADSLADVKLLQVWSRATSVRILGNAAQTAIDVPCQSHHPQLYHKSGDPGRRDYKEREEGWGGSLRDGVDRAWENFLHSVPKSPPGPHEGANRATSQHPPPDGH
ncbi:hypothetical protein BDK51DRAFT_52028 [Blyttiomyces helicus]|uniref:Uncharacterized protein n=1 Tax=Blyttiomyces helicus TaxID=388810 RepID=A0A4V1IRQ8_9FUNG|nr:hypothetical protein BDK51DRAFT_52028 [Blyttiomyces helicus]|eukprot:RKO90907.1 hypothetical protein BDK51DRAFT_52028 [Blyttiomyces helicus]